MYISPGISRSTSSQWHLFQISKNQKSFHLAVFYYSRSQDLFNCTSLRTLISKIVVHVNIVNFYVGNKVTAMLAKFMNYTKYATP